MKRFICILVALLGAMAVVASQYMIKTHIMSPDDDAAMHLANYWKNDWRNELIFMQFLGFLTCFFCFISAYILQRPRIILAAGVLSSIAFCLISLELQRSAPDSGYMVELDAAALIYIIGSVCISWWYQPSTASTDRLKNDAAFTSH